MRLLQLNAWAARLDKLVGDLLIVQNADIVCLQEIIDKADNAGLFSSFGELQNTADYRYSFHSPVMSFRFMDKTAHFGNGILSKLPYSDKHTIFTNLSYVKDFSFDEHDYNIRNLQHAVIKTQAGSLHVLNHHGHHVREHKNGNHDTLRQCQQIADYIDTLAGPIILTGDFNLAPNSTSLQIINKKLRNLSLESNITTTRNYLTHKTEVCDYIFVNDKVSVRKFEKLDDIVSDHAALILEFEI